MAEDPNPQRLGELAQGLGYWAARWQAAPRPVTPRGSSSAAEALGALPAMERDAGLRSRITDISHSAAWASAVERRRPIEDPSGVPDALDDLVDAAVARYLSWAPESPVMLVHVATAPRAASLVVPHLPRELWIATYDHAWVASATMASAYRPARPDPMEADVVELPDEQPIDEEDVVDRIVATNDEHALKFAEVACESFQRRGPIALRSAQRAAELIGNG